MAGTPLRLEWSDRARDQLLQVLSYYGEHASTAVARRVLGQIQTRAEELAQFPLSGVAIEGLDQTFRRATAGSRLLRYRVLTEQHTLRVLAVRHSRRRPLSAANVEALDSG